MERESIETEEASNIDIMVPMCYHKLPERRHQRRPPSIKIAWVTVRRATARAAGLCVGRMRWAARCMKRVTWVALRARVRQALSHAPPALTATYDSDGYALNFDDGRWKDEEDYWRSGAFARRFAGSASSGT